MNPYLTNDQLLALRGLAKQHNEQILRKLIETRKGLQKICDVADSVTGLHALIKEHDVKPDEIYMVLKYKGVFVNELLKSVQIFDQTIDYLQSTLKNLDSQMGDVELKSV